MNWKQVEGNWDQLKGKLRTKWGKLTNDDLEQARGRRDRLVGIIESRYGEARERVERELDKWIDQLAA